ncbi:MAG: hypothetical protein SFY81_09535 [Verrucomicrobiota bacterium]|nr:hypothetical protein [Verrucomicrobiota bacterium]
MIITEAKSAYNAERINFPWEDGDVLPLDNMSLAHGRQAHKRTARVVMAMFEPVSSTQN